MKSEYDLLISGRSGNQPTIMEILIGLYIQKHDGTLGDEHARRVRKARAKPFFCFIGRFFRSHEKESDIFLFCRKSLETPRNLQFIVRGGGPRSGRRRTRQSAGHADRCDAA